MYAVKPNPYPNCSMNMQLPIIVMLSGITMLMYTYTASGSEMAITIGHSQYFKPFLEVLLIEDDIVTVSNDGGNGGGDLGGGEDELPVMPF